MESVIVAGGGVIGLCVAWRAAQRGFRVTVLDPAPGQGASHAAAGMLTPVSEAACGEPAGFRQTGTLQVGYDADDLAVIDELHGLQDSLGVPARRLTARECRAAEPMLDPSVRGGLLVERDGSVDPRLLTRALQTAAERAGAETIPQTAVEVVKDHFSEHIRGVRLADGATLSADWTVL